MTRPANESMSDWTECRLCVAENDKLGGGRGHADRYFNHGGDLWAVCDVHHVRWYVTREIGCAPAATAADVQIATVDRVWRLAHDGYKGGRSGPRP